jgi:membrane-bound lytic murein transglycosylase B
MRLAALALAGLLFSTAVYADYSNHPRAPELLSLLRNDYGFTDADIAGVTQALAQAEQIPRLIQAEQQAKEKTLTWDEYRRIHLIDKNFRNGAKFLADNRAWLAKAEAEYGVPPAVIAAILGVETKFGTYASPNRALDALATQGFDHPTRSTFFFHELAEFFVLCKEARFKPAEVRGSYAGAVGMAQFMPSNYRRYAVDFDGDGVRDLWKTPDAIGSIANYLVNYAPALAWQRGLPLAVPANLKSKPGSDWPLNTKKQTHYIADFLRAGVHPAVALPPDMPAGLLDLTLKNGHEYWIGLHNFYAVMTYNPRVYYAMAVTQLAEALQLQQEAAP